MDTIIKLLTLLTALDVSSAVIPEANLSNTCSKFWKINGKIS